MTRTAYIALSGNLTSSDAFVIAAKHDARAFCIGADGGARILVSAGIVPDVVIGDFDSLSSEELARISQGKTRIVSHPRDKDQTDGELAVLCARDAGCCHIVIGGFLGDRIDHMMANIQYYATLAKDISISVMEGDQTIYVVRDKIALTGSSGDELSLIPLSDDCSGIRTEGLMYQLDNADLRQGSTRGVSNVFQSSYASIACRTGTLLVVHRRCAA